MRTRWEYTHRTFFGDQVHLLVDDLNELGQEGWEAVHFQHSNIHDGSSGKMIGQDTTVLLKRPIKEVPTVQRCEMSADPALSSGSTPVCVRARGHDGDHVFGRLS